MDTSLTDRVEMRWSADPDAPLHDGNLVTLRAGDGQVMLTEESRTELEAIGALIAEVHQLLSEGRLGSSEAETARVVELLRRVRDGERMADVGR